ncbi:hypothetical protein ABT168_28260, partial [Streptomyces sp. NPDC001793]|uniref:hypothetical protein n=1 Tax=Streptomyces sp. NPDC001793 TaxID=3154657 RepID=UPI0033254725
MPYPEFVLAVLVAAVGLFPLRRRYPTAVLLVLAALTGLSPAVGPSPSPTETTVSCTCWPTASSRI